LRKNDSNIAIANYNGIMDGALTYLKPLYKNDSHRIIDELKAYSKTLNHLKPSSERPFWYKHLDLYVVYPDGIIHDTAIPKLRNLLPHMLYIKTLGCNAVHILPFLQSPMIDKGFDVSDYMNVRSDLGSIDDIKALMNEASRANIKVFMDLVFNHVSDQHSWFLKAQQGSQKYKNYFITCKKKPVFLGIIHKNNAVWAQYMVKGKRVDVNVAFPEFIGEIPHFRQGKDGYWYYHTYFPHELDLNWYNADIFIEAAKVMMYWASLGFNFRLDAIPFVGKSAYKEEHHESGNTFLITAALKKIAAEINPDSAFLVETYEKLDKVIDYFGTSNRIQANLSYNFHLCTNIWVSLVTHDPKFIWQKLDKEEQIPKHAEWLNFLRNHDELSLAYLDDTLTKEVNEALLKNGEPFREHYGIAGRTFSLIGSQYKRFLMAYFLLASFPGGLAIPYGDEIAYRNTPLYKMQEIERIDPRNINRGAITREEFQRHQSKKISWKMCTIIAQRKRLRDYLHIWPKKISTPKEVFGAVYKLGSSELFVYINLSATRKYIKKKLTGFNEIASINASKLNGSIITLGPYAGVWLQK
jgi:maltose alpha-D-glucosyltransferase/alpha-amylase